MIHRDLKPANVRVTPDGAVKLLDFGLAKSSRQPESGSETDSVLSTEGGRLLGTPTYMAPEQARGKPIDRRVDVWAFGCVLYECLTGRRAYRGETLSDVLASVLHTVPDFTALPADTPPRVRRLLADCFRHDPRDRLRDCGEARRVLEHAFDPDDAADSVAPARSAGLARVAAAFVLGAIVAVAASWALLPDREPAPAARAPVRSTVLLPDDLQLWATERPLALSPDGSRLALAGRNPGSRSLLWIRHLDSAVPQPLAGTEDATYPFWSPDGEHLAFFADGKLKRVPAAGGRVTTLCASTSSRGGTWGEDGTLVFSPDAFRGLFAVPATGGTPTPLTEVGPEESHRLPHFLPGGRRLLYLTSGGTGGGPGVRVLDLDTGADTPLMDDASGTLYARPGWLCFVRDGNLMAQAFDADTLTLSGEPRLLAESVAYAAFRHTGPYDVSQSGVLVYVGESTDTRLRWIEADGSTGDWLGEPQNYQSLSISPDGRRAVAEVLADDGLLDLQVIDLERGLPRTVLRSPAGRGTGMPPTWSPDGTRVVTSFDQAGSAQPYGRVVDLATGAVGEPLNPGWPTDWSPDDDWLLVHEQRPEGGFDLVRVPLDPDLPSEPLLATQQNEFGGRLSPDGEWLLYIKDFAHLEVTSLREPGLAWSVCSMKGRAMFWWLKDGRVVFESGDDSTLWAVEVDTSGPEPRMGEPQPLLGGASTAGRYLALMPDASRALIITPPDPMLRRVVNLVIDWPAAFD